MDNLAKTGTIKAFERYEKILIDAAFSPQCNDELPMSGGHLLWMCQHCLDNISDDISDDDLFKYSRWLGYVQGIMATKNLLTVREERDITRPWFRGKTNAI